MAQSLSNFSSSIIPFCNSSSNNKLGDYDNRYYYGKFSETRMVRRPFCRGANGVKAMAYDRRENLDHLQRPVEIKRRETAISAPLGLWDRFPTAKTMQQMMETTERMVEEPLAFTSPLPNDGNAAYARGRTPWGIKEGETDYKLRFDVPGMTKEDVKVWVEEKMLVIKAEKIPRNKTDKENGAVEDEGENWPAKSFGRYSWRIALPDNVEFEKIKAEVRYGVLYVTIPKPRSTSKILDVNVE